MHEEAFVTDLLEEREERITFPEVPVSAINLYYYQCTSSIAHLSTAK
jgi:hypothetical protein